MSLPTILMPEPVPEPEVFPATSAKIIDNIENRQETEETDLYQYHNDKHQDN